MEKEKADEDAAKVGRIFLFFAGIASLKPLPNEMITMSFLLNFTGIQVKRGLRLVTTFDFGCPLTNYHESGPIDYLLAFRPNSRPNVATLRRLPMFTSLHRRWS